MCAWSCMAAVRPVPISPSAGGGVFSRCAIGSGAAGAAGLYAMGTKVCWESVGGDDAVVPGVMLGATDD